MSNLAQSVNETTRSRFSPETIALLQSVPILQTLDETGLHCLDGVNEYWAQPGETLIEQDTMSDVFWILLEGAVRLFHRNSDTSEETFHVYENGASFGEVTMLAGIPSFSSCTAVDSCHLLKLDDEHFWKLMTQCPGVRKAVLGNMAMRMAKSQQMSTQQAKMASLGTLAAGLMHELNNPGAAARRAAAQLRENMMRMHKLSAKWSRSEITMAQKECIFDLQDKALGSRPIVSMNALEQTDAEEALAEWMESEKIEDSWRIAPTFVSIGLGKDALECARASFSGTPYFSDAVNWLEALVSSMQLVGTIEESIGRVSELVMAVKSYAYEGRGGHKQDLDVNRSILATLVVLGHKIREKQIMLEKDLARDLPLLHSDCTGLNQIWTNLLDNSIDACPQGGKIVIKTWLEQDFGKDVLCILVGDNGSGIPAEIQPRIFDTFYTTKPAGVGTGLGLGIVYKIIEQFGGTVRFTSQPGDTEFVVRLPNRAA